MIIQRNAIVESLPEKMVHGRIPQDFPLLLGKIIDK